jgi:predicted aldo/keto reductase-like oxidoreductase
MRYQHKWQDVPMSEVPPENQANLAATIHRSLELGINHIETARGYGSSERQLAEVFRALPKDKWPREKLIIQTKVAPTADPKVFVAEFNDSLARLGLDYVDLLGLHGINTHEQLWSSVRPGGCLAAARELVAQGKVRHVGFSTHASLDVIQAAIAHQADGGFDYVNLHWYYIFQNNWPAIEAAARADTGVFIISPADKGGMLYRPSARLSELCAPLHPLVFNVLFCLQRPEVHTLSVGASCPKDFDLQYSALAQMGQVNELLPPIEKRLREAMIAAVGPDVADHFAEGLPAWQHSPGYMNVPVMIWLRNLALAYDMVEYGRMRYNLLGNGGHWFPGLNAANLDSLVLDGALDKSPFKQQIPAWLRETHNMLGGEPKMRLSTT